MEIKLYEDWMQPQVLKLFSDQYGRAEQELFDIHTKFYDHSFQKNKCIRIVALDGDIITGFQSLFYWPYIKNDKIYRTFQSGNSIVHPSYRGKGIFQQLLNYLDNHNEDLKIDFLLGFPVEASFGSFIRNNWTNPFNLSWYLKLINPLAFLFSKNRLIKNFEKEPKLINPFSSDNIFRLNFDKDFQSWRSGFVDEKKYFYYNYTEGNLSITFGLKFNQRSKYFNELIIGEIRTNSYDSVFLKKAFKNLIKKSRLTLCVTALTIALNDTNNSSILNAIKSSSFIKTKKQIYFITKSYNNNSEINEPSNWELFRSDIDSW